MNPKGPSVCILVVEDDPSIRLGLTDNLEAEGYRVQTAADGETGLRAACEAGVDLVILDRMLPDGDGLVVLERLRRRGISLPVLILTARGAEEDRVAGLLHGADDYVVKPFSLAELLARVAAVLRRTRPSPGTLQPVGDSLLDADARVLRRGEEWLPLTPREFDLLVHLVRRPGRVWTRAELLDAVWGVSYEGTDRVVDRFIVSLRKKVEPDPERPRHILTVAGVGYRYEA